MPFKSIYCVKDGPSFHLINLNSLEVKSIPHSNVKNMVSCLRNGSYNEIQEFIGAESFVKTMQVSLPTFTINPLIVLSFECNYRCEYCYQKERKKDHAQLLPDDLVLIDKFYDYFCQHYDVPKHYGIFTIIGGEPLLPKNRLVLDYIFKMWQGKEFAITTNGTYVEDFFDILSKNKVRLKISLDGTREMHFEKRHTKDFSAYEKTINGIKLLVNSRIPVTIVSVYNPKNHQRYPDFFDEMETYGWLSTPYLRLAFIPEMGKGCDDINLKYLYSANQSFKRLKELDNRAIYVDARQLVPGAVPLQRALVEAQSKHTYNPYRCPLLKEPDYSFLPNGNVLLCLAIDNHVGVVGKYKPRIEIDFKKIDQLKFRRIDKMSKCVSCKFRILCRGGCVATALEKFGTVNDPYCGMWEKPFFLEYFENVMKHPLVNYGEEDEKSIIDR